MRVFVAKFYEMVVGVYSTREKAEKYGTPLVKETYGSDSCSIEEWEVDGEEII